MATLFVRGRPHRRWLHSLILIVLLAAAALVPAVPARAAADFALGDAPRRVEPQDIGDWVPPVMPKWGKTRAEVVALYNNQYLPGNAAALEWTGAIAGCAPGTTNIEHQHAVITRVNYFRALVDLPGVNLIGGTATEQAQAAALIMTANTALSHTPPPSWICHSVGGATGAANANLALGRNGVSAVDLYMDDAGANNAAVGHRRWILHPPRTGMGTGDTPGGSTPPRPANALYVFGPTGRRPQTTWGIAWPPLGFVPYQNLPAMSNRWSFSLPGADFSNATVTMGGPDGLIPVTLEPLANGFGDNTLVFQPTLATASKAGVSYGPPSADTDYVVIVNGIAVNGGSTGFVYTVRVINPAVAPPAPGTALAVEYYNAALDHYFVTHLPAEIAILDTGITMRGWVRTGETFLVYAASASDTSPVCRFYIPPALGDSHFYGRGTAECDATGATNPAFINEDAQFFHMALPVGGVCPVGTRVVYRVFSNRPDANHRYIVQSAIRDEMVARGWLAEGDGGDRVVMCGPA